MTIFQLVSHDQLSPIGGASAWSFEDPSKPEVLGYSDQLGIISIASTSGFHKIRFVAYGHTAKDYSGPVSENIGIEMTQNHSASYSGYLPNSRMAIWHNETSDRYFEFTAIGNYRTAKGYRKLLESDHIQYRMPQSTSWYPPGPKVKKPSGGLGKLPPLLGLKWSYLFLRNDVFPTDDRWVSVVDPRNSRFRFPSPGIMIVNGSDDTETNDGTEYKLVS